MPMQNEDSNNTFIVSPAEWREAEKYFNENIKEVKFKRSRPGKSSEYQNKYSFIKVGEKIYAMANKQATGHSLGKGGYGYVKMALAEDGEKFAVKIESRRIRTEDDAEKIVMNEIGFLKGELERELEKPIRIGPQTSKHKLYTIMPLILGKSLRTAILEHSRMEDSNEVRYWIGIQTALN